MQLEVNVRFSARALLRPRVIHKKNKIILLICGADLYQVINKRDILSQVIFEKLFVSFFLGVNCVLLSSQHWSYCSV